MLVAAAHADREARYNKWYPLFEEELELVAAPNATFVAVGAAVRKYLHGKGFSRPLVQIIHYSGQAARARKDSPAGRESEFQAF